MYRFVYIQTGHSKVKIFGKMNIGVITFWQTRDNYGQILQCFAMQRVLEKIGHNTYLIQYKHSETRPSLRTKVEFFFVNLLRRNWHNLYLKDVTLPAPTINDVKRDFESFKNQYLVKSANTYVSLNELRENPPIADAYFVGSDQVWFKSLLFEENKVFFLNFGDKNIKRIAYAASFSMTEYPAYLLPRLRKQLSRFDSISVRERTALKFCKDAGCEADVVLDPTLLLTKQDYISLLQLSSNPNNELFIYCLNINSKDDIQFDELEVMAYERHLKIVVTPSSGYINSQELFPNVEYQYHTIKSWIEQIMNSNCVVTTSFHGIMFSIIFHIPFIYIPLKGGYSHGNNRVLDFLDELGMEARILTASKSYSSIYKSPIDWSAVDAKLSELRKKSIDFIIQSLNK